MKNGFLLVKKNQTRNDFYGFEKWYESTSIALDLSKNGKLLILSYQDLKLNTKAVVKKLFQRLGLALHEQTLEFIRLSTSKKLPGPYEVFRNHNKRQINNIPQTIMETMSNDTRMWARLNDLQKRSVINNLN